MSKRIPSHIVDQIYAAADIVEVVGDYLELKKRGTTYFARSPFRDEKTPSFAVSPSKNIFKDFSSGKGGNAVTFLMEVEGMSFVEALKHLAEKYGIDLQLEETQEDLVSKDKRESLYILNEFAARYFHDQLMKEDEGRRIGLSYFKERGILESTIDEFQLGYSPNSWDAFSKVALANTFSEEYLTETGLCFKSDRDGKILDRFKGRIMFPIHNHLGKVVGFGGRILDKSSKSAKYINSPESEIYHKSKILYGLHQGKQSIRDLDFSMLVEGYMDVIALYQSGIKNVVASSGTALTDDQIRLLKRFSKNVLLIYDADPAGINAALRGADLLLAQELNVRVLLLPPGHDPDSYVKEHGKSGFDAFREEQATDFIEFKIQHLFKQLDPSDPGDKTRLIHDVASTIARIPDEIKKAVYIDTAARLIGISGDIIRKAVEQAISTKNRQDERTERFRQKREGTAPTTPAETTAAATLPSATTELPSQEVEILRLIMNHHDQVLALNEEEIPLPEFFIVELTDLAFSNPITESFKQMLFEEFDRIGRINIHRYINHETKEFAALAQELLTIPFEVSENWMKFEIRAPKIDEDLELGATNTILHYKRIRINDLLQESRNKIKACKNDVEMDSLAKRHVALEMMRKQLSETIGTEGAIDARIIE